MLPPPIDSSPKSTQQHIRAHSAQRRARAHLTHSVTSMFIPPIAQSRKPSREPKNKKSILAATFLRLAIVPSCRITDQGAKVQVIRHETSDSCFAWDERELLIAKKLQKYLDFCFNNGRICRSRTNPAKDRLPTAATKSIPRNGGIGQPITDVSIPSVFLNDSYS